MSETANTVGSSASGEKPVLLNRPLSNDVKFPPIPEPTEEEFEEDIGDDERNYYRSKFADLDIVKNMRLHCSACDRHLGSSTRNESRMRAHPMLRTLVCHTCHTFYNSGEFEKGDDGSELYCRWCGQGGQVYCCSNCPHVFCAKCIKRNLGVQKIKEIENTDDWKCFKCNPKCLWDLRAVCWALLRYCDVKNKITYKTEDSELKELYQKDCALDHTECCKHKTNRRRDKTEAAKKKDDKKTASATSAASVISKISSAIQVKKFASINVDDSAKEKKPQKRPANTNENKVVFIKNPISIAPPPTAINPVSITPAKKPRMPVVNPVRFVQQERKQFNTYARIRPKIPSMPIPIIPSQFNGFNMNNNSFPNFTNIVTNDTLNLSLESLTQGLDMVAVAAMNTSSTQAQDDDVICTPDFPLEPLCEVTEDNTDDDVQCITPGPVAAPKIPAQAVLPRNDSALPDLTSDNIVQMTDNDVTVNALTGGLKFRVDPQTLSSNKMYRLPDGRIFAIKANPNMPGGYSATIVAVTETGLSKNASKGTTYAAKLSAVTTSQTSTPIRSQRSSLSGQGPTTKRSTPKSAKVTRGTDTSTRECDLQVPVEWFRFNLIDAVDALEYSLNRLQKLKKEATCRHLRTRSVEEMKSLHRTLDRLLNTSATRFQEIKENLNKELKQYIIKKAGGTLSDDDDDVEILPDLEDNDDPIFIDENSVESNSNDVTCNVSQEVDLTGVGSSDHNDSTEIITDTEPKVDKDLLNADDERTLAENRFGTLDVTSNNADNLKDEESSENTQVEFSLDKNRDGKNHSPQSFEEVNESAKYDDENEDDDKKDENDKKAENDNENKNVEKDEIDKKGKDEDETKNYETNKEAKEVKDNIPDKHCQVTVPEIKVEKTFNGNSERENIKDQDKFKDEEKKILSDDNSNQDNDEKFKDTEMSEEMIENLLNEDNTDEANNVLNNKSMEVVESI